LVVPVFLLIFFIFYLLVKTGEIDGEDQNLMDKIEASDSYSALLWGTMAAGICSVIFYLLQIVQDGEFVIPKLDVIKRLLPFRKANEEDPKPRSIMSVFDSSESFLFGMGRIFPALIVLTLAWASGAIMVAVGADRLFSRWIVGGIAPEALPTLHSSFPCSWLRDWHVHVSHVCLIRSNFLSLFSEVYDLSHTHMSSFFYHLKGTSWGVSIPVMWYLLAGLGRGCHYLLRDHGWSPEWECGRRSHQSHF
jgi:hypothetical protein